ncbi:MAG: protein kinase [Anaerolineales bacterium]|nr:protein kinase [Anaerolineales bacterium]
MENLITFGQIVREQRAVLGLTQAELALRAGCAPITIRKIEGDTLRPSVQLAELLAVALGIPENEQRGFIQLARQEKQPTPIPRPTPSHSEIGLENLSGRAVKGFELAEKIGSGGFGVVYRAIQPAVDREVAVKIILPRYANHPTFIRRFEAEAHLIAQLEHPHIVPLYDYWRDPDAAYLIMRLLRGGSLETLLAQGQLPPGSFRRIALQIGQALATAHSQGVIHRDIKPANVLLDETQNAYLADFGIAKNLALTGKTSLTEEGSLLGSPAYLSPEQIQNEPLRATSDIYCFGLLLYEMLTGERAFNGPTPVAYLQQHLNEPIPSILAKRSDLPTALDDLIQRAGAKNPNHRFASVNALLEQFEHILVGTSLTAISTTSSHKEPHALSAEEVQALSNPYRGLHPFTEADAGSFFGRETLVQELLGLLSDGSDLERFLAVVGPSGSGKTSAVKAGLIPALRRGGLPDSDSWFIVDFTPGGQPWEKVEAALLRVAINPSDNLLVQLQASKRGLLRAVHHILPDDGETELLLVIDQFEELFTLVADETVRTHFLESLITAVLDPHSRLRIVITMRADFIDRPLQYIDFGEILRQRLVLVLPLTADELTHAIVRPVENLGMSLEPELVSTIIQDVGDQPGILPLLQYALTELFEQRTTAILTRNHYRATEGVTGALARRADDIYKNLDPAGQQAARQIFLRLVTLGEGVEDTRRRVLLTELEALDSANSHEQQEDDDFKQRGQSLTTSSVNLVNLFGRYRLLTFDHDPGTRGSTVEVAHEALLREWPRLRGWLRESREDIRRQRELATMAQQWRTNQRDESYLLRGSRLVSFADWQAATTVALTNAERNFLKSSINVRDARRLEEEARRQRELETAQQLAQEQTARAEEQTRSVQRFRYFSIALAVLLILAIGAAWLAVTRGQVAAANLVESERSRLALQAQNALDRGEGSEIASLLAIRSLQFGYSPEANAALQAALARGFARQTFLGHTDDVQMVEFSPDGLYIASSASDGSVRLWDAQTGKQLQQFNGHEATVLLVDFSPDGSLLATSSSDQTVRVWDIASGQELHRFPGHTLAAGIDFSANGSKLLVFIPGQIKIYEIPSTNLVLQIDTGTGESGSIAEFSPDENYIITVPTRGKIRLWDAHTGKELNELVGHVGWVGYGTFSPDSQFALTVGQDGTARLWDVATGNEVRRFIGHTDAVFNGFFSPNGQYIVTGSYDRTARLWDVATGREVKQFRGHTDFVNVGFSPDSKRVVTGSGDHIIKLWDVETEPEPRQLADFSLDHLQDQTAITVSPDGQFVLVGRLSGAIQVINTQTQIVESELNTGALPITAQALAHGQQFVVSGNNSGHIQLWDRTNGVELWRFVGHAGAISAVVFSPDDQFILTASHDGTSRLLDVATGQEIMQLAHHNSPILAVAFAPDGQTALAGRQDGTAYVWGVSTGREALQLVGHADAIHVVAFSPDG